MASNNSEWATFVEEYRIEDLYIFDDDEEVFFLFLKG